MFQLSCFYTSGVIKQGVLVAGFFLSCVAVKELRLNYHKSETMLLIIDPYIYMLWLLWQLN